MIISPQETDGQTDQPSPGAEQSEKSNDQPGHVGLREGEVVHIVDVPINKQTNNEQRNKTEVSEVRVCKEYGD